MKRTLPGSPGLSTSCTSLVCLLGFLVAINTAEAQFSYSGGSYTQNFDSLPASGSTVTWVDNSKLPGWYAWRAALASPPSTLNADDGSDTSTSVLHSHGTAGSADRALGTLPGTTSGDWLVGVRLRNDSSTTYTSFTFSFDGEQWRAASATPRTLTADWTIGNPANLGDANAVWKTVDYAKFVSPTLNTAGVPLGGNDPANRQGTITGTVTGIQWAPGTDLWIRFTNAAVSGGNMGLAIDNFSFSASTDRLAGFRGEAINTVTDVNTKLATSTADLEVRALPLAAYISLVLNFPNAVTAESNARRYIDAMLTKQDTNSNSATFGHFCWSYDQSAPTDLNATEFCLRPLAVILQNYRDRLGITYVNGIKPKILNALSASRGRTVGANYTNIYSMRVLNWVLLGEALSDTTSLNAGKTALDTWLADVAQEGMHEYDSPTYSVVTYSNLLLGAHNIGKYDANNLVLADTFRSVATFLATDLTANYFDGQRRLSGSRSRDYDFVTGDDAVNQFYYLEGLRASLPKFYVKNEGVIPYLDRLENGGGLPADVLDWASNWSQLVIKSRWGPTTSVGQDRYNFITSDFSIGSSGTYYGDSQDKAVAADVNSTNLLTQFSLVYDPYDAPYGQVKVDNVAGILKPNHLKFFGANVQEKGSILSLANLAPNFTSPNFLGPYKSISSAFVFPTQADAPYINGSVVSKTAGSSYTVNSGTVVGVRVGNAVIAARFLVVDSLGGYTPTYAVKLDGPGGANAGRFVAYHWTSGSAQSFTSADKPRVAVFISARTCVDSTAITNFLNEVKSAVPTVTNGTAWSVSMLVGGVTLKATQDASSGAIIERKVNGTNYIPATLTFNDGGSTNRDIFAERFTSMIDSGWVRCDIGSVAAASTASYQASTGNTAVTASGADFWDVADSGAFTYRTVTGDCDLIARVDSQTNSNIWAKAGVMIRETLDASSKCALTYITPGNGARFSYRANTGDTSSRTGLTGITSPYWVRITRTGDSISSSVSTDKVTWRPLGSTQAIPMNTTVYIGLAVASCNSTVTSTAVFSKVSVQ